jgi:hypothetical protein
MLCLFVLASSPLAAQARVATLDAVRLRATPAATGAAVRTLEIATPLTSEAAWVGEWVRVRTADGARGWVRRDLTVPYDAANPLPALRRIAARSVAQEQAPFATRARLVNVLTDAAGAASAPAAKAELSLLRLQALQKALDEHARERSGDYDARPLRDGRIRADSSEVAYGEPQGQWYVTADAFWALQRRYRALPIAEAIAWEAANQQLPGECESDPTCIFGLAEMTAGRYLSLYPRGAHAPAALRKLVEVLGWVEEQSRGSSGARFCTRSGANYTLKPDRIAALGRTVEASAGADKARAGTLVRTLARRCA